MNRRSDLFGVRGSMREPPSAAGKRSGTPNVVRWRALINGTVLQIVLPSRILARQESEDAVGEDFGHLIGKRHHGARDLDHTRACNGIGNAA